MYKVLYNIKKMVSVDIGLYNYLIRDNSIMSKPVGVRNLDIIYIMEERLDFFEEKNEERLKQLTLVTYLRILLDLSTKFYYSKLDNKKSILNIIIQKIEDRKLEFKKNQYNTTICKNILFLYNINKYFCFYINKQLFILKKYINKDR